METASRETVTTTPQIEDIPLVGERFTPSFCLNEILCVCWACFCGNELLSGLSKKRGGWVDLHVVVMHHGSRVPSSQDGQILAFFNSSRTQEGLGFIEFSSQCLGSFRSGPHSD